MVKICPQSFFRRYYIHSYIGPQLYERLFAKEQFAGKNAYGLLNMHTEGFLFV